MVTDDMIVYTVNGENTVFSHRSAAVRAILEASGFTPAESYILKRLSPPEDFRGRHDAIVLVHDGDEFHVFYIGPAYSA